MVKKTKTKKKTENILIAFQKTETTAKIWMSPLFGVIHDQFKQI